MSRISGAILITLGIALAYVFFGLPFASFFRGEFVLWRPERPFELVSFMYWSVPAGILILVLAGLAPLLGMETNRRIGLLVVLAGGLPVLTSLLHLSNISTSNPRNSSNVINLLGSGFWGTAIIGALIALVGAEMLMRKPKAQEAAPETE